jgi:hypothetical protein
MSLNKTTLKNAFKTAFDTAKEEGWTTEQVATALADAIDAFVRSGDVVQITVKVVNPAGAEIGTGTQTGKGKIE